MKDNAHFWKYLTAIVVMFLLLNPEAIEIAVVINTIGLDMFLLLVQVQIVFMLKTIVANPVFQKICEQSSRLKEMVLIQYPQTMLMHLLVFMAVVGAIVNV